uniref:Ribosomal protein S19 n=1 Tax=Francoa sonchifolia TaxID=23250 RepID=A0A0G2YF86_9ROSI|nr:ribosomal protein S19 [Francoa sonchifolia]
MAIHSIARSLFSSRSFTTAPATISTVASSSSVISRLSSFSAPAAATIGRHITPPPGEVFFNGQLVRHYSRSIWKGSFLDGYLLKLKSKKDPISSKKFGHVDLLFCRNLLVQLYEFTMEKLLLNVRLLKEKLVISLESLHLRGNVDRKQLLNRKRRKVIRRRRNKEELRNDCRRNGGIRHNGYVLELCLAHVYVNV